MIKAQISSIKTSAELNLLCAKTELGDLNFVTLELPSDVFVGSFVLLDFKSSDVIISKQRLISSVQNSFLVEISAISRGEILSVLELKKGEILFESMITTSSLDRLELRKNDEIYANIKATSIYINKILNA